MKRLALFTFIDAFGWEILQRHRFLEDVVKTRAPLTTIFGYSATCDPTIITGLLPRDHGHFSFFVHDPARSPFKTARMLSLLPAFITRRGRVRNVISRFYKKYLGYTGYFQLYNMPFRTLHLYDYTEKNDIYEKGGINSGAHSIFDRLRQQRIPYFLADWRASEEKNIKALHNRIEQGEIRFAYLYLAAMDATLHKYGTKSPKIADKIAWYNAQLHEILQKAAGLYDEVCFYAFSDHGMTDVNGSCDLMKLINSLPLKQNRDYAVVYDSTMARFWFLRNGARDVICNALAGCEHGRILSAATLHDWGCDFADQRYGQLFFLMNPGILLNPSYMGETMLAGMHGYDPDDRDSTASFLANREIKDPPRRLDDLFGLMNYEIDNL